jgi:hypothetical protein
MSAASDAAALEERLAEAREALAAVKAEAAEGRGARISADAAEAGAAREAFRQLKARGAELAQEVADIEAEIGALQPAIAAEREAEFERGRVRDWFRALQLLDSREQLCGEIDALLEMLVQRTAAIEVASAQIRSLTRHSTLLGFSPVMESILGCLVRDGMAPLETLPSRFGHLDSLRAVPKVASDGAQIAAELRRTAPAAARAQASTPAAAAA